MEKIGIFYSFKAFKSGQVAKRIIEHFNDNIEAVDADNLQEASIKKYTNLIFGVPTWFDGELPNYWDEFVPALEEMDLKYKRIALYGNGDQKGYPENFVDAVGIMTRLLHSRGATIVGYTSTKGYTFEQSLAQEGDQFTGLALDFENEGKKVNSRVENWCKQLENEFS
jgi:flavodoxin I